MSLDVYLYGERVGILFPAGDDDYRFAYDPDLSKELGLGAGLLSNALPVRTEPFSSEATRAYVEGLLPEGPRRARIGRELGIDATDGYLLLAEIGADCPGAVSFVPRGQEVVVRGPDEISWLDEDELGELLRPPPPAYFTAEAPLRMRAALPGVRHKLSLVRDEAGDRWGWPEAGVPSTHVIKPDTGEFPGMVANEMFCMSVMRQLGFSVAEAEVREIAGRRCLVSPRYDRVVGPSGTRRLHCESFVQALGIAPFAPEGSEEANAPSFAEARGLLLASAEEDDFFHLLAASFCYHALGNGDAHGRNFALLDPVRAALGDRPGLKRLAPLTDVLSTAVYDDPIHIGMTVADHYDEHLYLIELAEVCEKSALDFEMMREIAGISGARVSRAVETIATRACVEGWHEPIVDKIVELAIERSFSLLSEVEY